MSRHTASGGLDILVYRAAFTKLRDLVAHHIAYALINGDDAEHGHACDLARNLDEAGLNIDHLVDDRLDNPLSATPTWAWKSPAVRKAEAEIDVPF